MNILALQPYNYINVKNLTANKYNAKRKTVVYANESCAFTSNILPINFRGVSANYAVSRLNEISVKEYKKLSPKIIEKLRAECSEILYSPEKIRITKNIESQHEIASDLIIKVLDTKYGKGNWIIISLGRSVSSIAKVIGYKIGEDSVKQLPMTRANRFVGINNIKNIENTEGLEVLKKYLDSVGLNKKNISESNKHYIIIDYCYSGGSLLGGYKLLTSDVLLGNASKIHMINVMELLPKGTAIYSQLDEYFYHSRFKKYSEVKQCRDLKETFNSVCGMNDFSLEENLMRFKLLDNIMTKK